jgi:hypothetical protein
MDVEIERRPKALDQRDGAGLSLLACEAGFLQ